MIIFQNIQMSKTFVYHFVNSTTDIKSSAVCSKAVAQLLLIAAPIVYGTCGHCFVVLCILSSFTILLEKERASCYIIFRMFVAVIILCPFLTVCCCDISWS